MSRTTSDTGYWELLEARNVQKKMTTETVYMSPDSTRMRTIRVNLWFPPRRVTLWEAIAALIVMIRYTIMPI